MPLRALVLEQDEIVIAERDEPLVACEPLQLHVRRGVRAEGQRLQRRLPLLVDRPCRDLLRGIELIDDVDRLRRHAELRHEASRR